MTFSLKGLKTITNYQYEPACGILSLLDIFELWKTRLFCFVLLLQTLIRISTQQLDIGDVARGLPCVTYVSKNQKNS